MNRITTVPAGGNASIQLDHVPEFLSVIPAGLGLSCSASTSSHQFFRNFDFLGTFSKGPAVQASYLFGSSGASARLFPAAFFVRSSPAQVLGGFSSVNAVTLPLANGRYDDTFELTFSNPTGTDINVNVCAFSNNRVSKDDCLLLKYDTFFMSGTSRTVSDFSLLAICAVYEDGVLDADQDIQLNGVLEYSDSYALSFNTGLELDAFDSPYIARYGMISNNAENPIRSLELNSTSGTIHVCRVSGVPQSK